MKRCVICARLLTPAAFLIFSTFSASPALAQDSPQPSPEAVEKAKKLYEAAEIAYNAHEYEKALTGFQEAYKLTQYPALFANMGQSYRFLHCYDEAIKDLSSYLEKSPPGEIPDELRKNTEIAIAEVRASKANPNSPTCQLAPPPPETNKVLDDKPPTEKKVLPALVIGGVGLGLGIVFGGLGLSSSNQAEELTQLNEGDTPDPAALEQKLKQVKAFNGLSAAFVGLGIVGLGVGTSFALKNKKSEVKLSISVTGVSYQVRF